MAQLTIGLLVFLLGIYYATVILHYAGLPIFKSKIEFGKALRPFYYWVKSKSI